MKKKVTSIILIGMMVHSVYACGSITPEEADYDEINQPVREELSETEIVQGKERPEETEDTFSNSEVQQAADDESSEPIYVIEPGLTQDDTYEMQDWQAAYTEYIESVEYAPYNEYALIYVDEDDIPELVICTGTVATACTVLTFHDGQVDALQTWSLQCNYIEKKNLYWDAGGQMGEFYDQVYTIENGKWVHVLGGEYIAKLDEDGLITDEYDYTWEGEAVPENIYYKNLHAVYDIEENQNVGSEQYVKFDEMLLRLQTGNNDMLRPHRYELYVEDITWDEAKRRCEERGGYLATITTIEEYEYIKKGIEDSGQTQVAFWLGASKSPSSNSFYRWDEPVEDYWNSDLVSGTIMGKYWADGEPSYDRRAFDGQTDRLCIYLLYDDAKKNCYLYDASTDMLARNPEYTGQIGYICEYGVTVRSKETYYHADGSISDWYEYEYDGLGNQTGYIHYYEDGSFHNSKYRQEYDDRGKMTKYISYNDDSSLNYWYENEYDSEGKQIKSITYKADGSIDSWSEYEYDSEGNRVKWIKYNAYGSILSWSEYEYDSAGNQTKENQYSSHGTLRSWEEREYDSVGYLIKSSGYNSNNNDYWWYEYEHDSAGNLTKSIRYQLGGSLDSWSEYGYDREGNQVKWIDYNADGSISRWYGDEYDSEGKKIKSISYHEDGSVDWWCECEYNSVGNTTQETFYDADGHICAWEKYEYDSRGNKTKQSYWHEEGNTQEYVWKYDNMGNLAKYMEYRRGELYEWYECEYITIVP